jgi:hypothetical protein
VILHTMRLRQPGETAVKCSVPVGMQLELERLVLNALLAAPPTELISLSVKVRVEAYRVLEPAEAGAAGGEG